MTSAELAEKANADGGRFYSAGRYDDAYSAYSLALSLVGEEKAELVAKYLSNRAAVSLALRNFSEAVADCTTAMRLQPENIKALIRRGVALFQSERLEMALSDFDLAISMLSKSATGAGLLNTAVEKRRECVAALAAASQYNQHTDAIAPPELLSEHHTKRLYFRTSPPKAVRSGEEFPLAVYAANEFGLHRRGSSVGIPLSCRLLRPTASIVLTLEPEGLALDERGKCSFSASLTSKDECATPQHVQLVIEALAIGSQSSLVPVVTPPILFTSSTTRAGSVKDVSPDPLYKLGDDDNLNCRLFTFSDAVEPLVFIESVGTLGIGGRLWDAGICLLQFFAAAPMETVSGRRVLELGAGTGVVGLGAAQLGASHVTITDLPSVCGLLEANIHLSGRTSRCTAAPLVWGSDVSSSSSVDLVIAADVVYEPECFQPLADTLTAVCTDNNCPAYLAYRPRHPDGSQFFDSLRKVFEVSELPFPPAAECGVTIFHIRLLARLGVGLPTSTA